VRLPTPNAGKKISSTFRKKKNWGVSFVSKVPTEGEEGRGLSKTKDRKGLPILHCTMRRRRNRSVHFRLYRRGERKKRGNRVLTTPYLWAKNSSPKGRGGNPQIQKIHAYWRKIPIRSRWLFWAEVVKGTTPKTSTRKKGPSKSKSQQGGHQNQIPDEGGKTRGNSLHRKCHGPERSNHQNMPLVPISGTLVLIKVSLAMGKFPKRRKPSLGEFPYVTVSLKRMNTM